MSNIKFQISKKGFTIIELITVIAIMAMMVTAIIININGQRTPRDLKIAQNELVSNIRKIQSYTLSSRNLSSDQSVQYYLIKFDISKPTQYTIQAMYDVSSSPMLQDVETIKFPPNIQLANTGFVSVLRPVNPIIQIPLGCALAAFATPFGKVLFNGSCGQSGWDTNDDYNKIINFVTNAACDGSNNPPVCTVSSDTFMTITIEDQNSTQQRKILVNGVTGAVCPTVNGTTCSASN